MMGLILGLSILKLFSTLCIGRLPCIVYVIKIFNQQKSFTRKRSFILFILQLIISQPPSYPSSVVPLKNWSHFRRQVSREGWGWGLCLSSFCDPYPEWSLTLYYSHVGYVSCVVSPRRTEGWGSGSSRRSGFWYLDIASVEVWSVTHGRSSEQYP